MKKRVLILSGSPRKGGNSDLLCDQFMIGAQESGHDVEKVFLRNQEIHYCTGCGTCFKKRGTCSQKDDMTQILDKMVTADVIVMATPVYFYTMNGQMKTLIDRTCARYTELSDKEFYFIATAAVGNDSALERTFEEFRGFTACLHHPQEKGLIYGTGLWEKGDVLGSPVLAEAGHMGKSV